MNGGTSHPERLKSRLNRFYRFFSDRDRGSAERVPAAAEEEASVSRGELVSWLGEHRDAVAERWLLEVRSRSESVDGELLGMIGEFLDLLTNLLPLGLGSFRGETEGFVQQASELYGNLAAHRGLAAGEAVEEVQLLRGVILRFLLTLPPEAGAGEFDLRDLLRLNRLIDLVVAHTSVGHTDTLFFNLFNGTGVSERPKPDLVAEVREQVSGIRDEIVALGRRAGDRAQPSREGGRRLER